MTWLFDAVAQTPSAPPLDLLTDGLFAARMSDVAHLLEFGPAFPVVQPVLDIPDEEELPEITEAQERARQTRLLIDVAREEAVKETRDQVTSEWTQKLEEERAHVSSILAGFAEERVRWFRRAEAEIVQLALAIARRVLDREMKQDPSALHEIARAAVGRVQDGSGVVLHVSPGRVSDWRSAFAAQPDLEVVADPTLVDGDCIVSTTFGRVELGLDVQLEEIEERLREMVGGPRRFRVTPSPTEEVAK